MASKTAVSFLIYDAEIRLQWTEFMLLKSATEILENNRSKRSSTSEEKYQPCSKLLDHIHTEMCNRLKSHTY
jgi:hypothetical protein